MAFLEKSNWVVLVVGVPTLLVYLVVIIPQVLANPITDVDWVEPMIATIVVFVVANVVGNVVAAASNPREAELSDERDSAIDRFGRHVGNWVLIGGSIVALVLAMARADHFWIANAIFLGGLLGSLVSAVAKAAAYRGSVERW